MIDFEDLALRTIQSQYGASPHIVGLVEKAAERLDPNKDIQTFYDKVFNPKTAQGIGLDIWGRIVGVDRYLVVDNEDAFGFLGSLLMGFNQAPFYVRGVTDRFRLSDEAYRFLIFLKAAANIGEATLPSIKRTLTAIFDQPVYVFNFAPMVVRVVFLFYLTPYQRALLMNYGLLNLGAGVGFEFYQIDPHGTFGFAGSGLQPFGQGIFDPFGIVLFTEE